MRVLLLVVFVALAIAATAVGVAWILLDRFVRLRDACHLEYAGEVRFSATCGEDYEIASWHAENWHDPEPCPFIVHLPTGDLDPAYLGAIDRLKGEAWTIYDWGGEEVELYLQERLVRCWFRGKRLTHVEVNVVPVQGRAVSPVSITLLGKTISLPASEQSIVSALGPPVSKHGP